MGCKRSFLLFFLLLCFIHSPLFSQGGIFDSPSEPEKPQEEEKDHKVHKSSGKEEHKDDHLLEAPASLMGTHIHQPGKIMVEYRYMLMNMQGLYSGGQTISPMFPLNLPHATGANGGTGGNSGSSTYMMVPQRMMMEMQMANVMASITENLSVMVMIPYVRNNMEMLNGGTYLKSYMSSKGIGDIQGQLTYRFVKMEHHNLLVNFGLSLPTGSVDQRDSMGQSMGMIQAKVPYNMQPGTRTYNPSPGLTYTGNSGGFFWGSQFLANLRYGKNDNGYRFGNRYEASLWAGFKILDWMSLLGRIQYQKWDNITGIDKALDQTMDPQNDPNLQGGRRGLVFAGMNIKLPFSSETETRINVEYGTPFYQHLNGPQLGAKSVFNLTAQLVF
ncbi:transporter [Leptospira semungkisensis]|uniref:Transporter n=1 Tax=Leptospira semungkisensis TaxID=2484985 RepID=A0A4R9G560_9LEPT|nr:transporter [Leptospira semungkisensis]TGK06574.1 transporter [Leptospira semungkisensis]